MHLLIVNCSPRVKQNSNTSIIIDAFAEGYIKNGNSVEIHNLSELQKWEEIRKAFYKNNNIVMAIPLYVECIPGIMIEFLESMALETANASDDKTLSFILQGGFAEASQLRCAEQYLEKLPAFLNCKYGGTLIKGDNFAINMLPKETAAKMVAPYSKMGEIFAQEGAFAKQAVDKFAAPEFFSKGYITLSKLLLFPLQKVFFNIFFKKLGCKGKLTDKPYQKHLE